MRVTKCCPAGKQSIAFSLLYFLLASGPVLTINNRKEHEEKTIRKGSEAKRRNKEKNL